MKKPLILSFSLALVGCSQTPGDGDIEKVLLPLFSTCKNIELDAVDKTNGYAEDGLYRVDFTYELKVDGDKLVKLREVYLVEKEQEAQSATHIADYEQRVRALEDEIFKLDQAFSESTPSPRQSEFAGENTTSDLSPTQWEAYKAASDAWQAARAENRKSKEIELDELKQSRKNAESKKPRPTFQSTARIGNDMVNFYEAGCAWEAQRFMVGMLSQHSEDQSTWFDQDTFKMNGKMTMRKTEQGWSPVGR